MWNRVLALTLALAASLPLLAQNYPMPSKVGEQATVCNGCGGTNSAGQPNDGKQTYQYNSPLSDHVGRFHDSNATKSVQNRGMRTLRAGKVRVTPQRGTAPPRVYIQLGETFAAYGLDSFFSRLGSPLTPVNQIEVPNRVAPWGGRSPYETILMMDAYFYPEGSAADWTVPLADNQDRLRDFDFDDRGNVYLAEDEFGWGLVKDTGQSSVGTLTSVVQFIGGGDDDLSSITRGDTSNIVPTTVISLKSGSNYYAFTSFDGADKVAKFNVTNVGAPSPEGVRSTNTGVTGIYRWSKDDGSRVLAVVNRDGKLRIYDYDAYINGTGPIKVVSPAASGTVMKDVVFDEKGDLWAVEAATSGLPTSTSSIHKLTRTSGYSDTVLSGVFTSSFAPVSVAANNGYVAVSGYGAGYVGDLYLYKMEGSGVHLLDTDGFFRKYYHSAPSGFAEPGIYTDTPQNEVRIVKNGTKTYLFYCPFGIGDVFQLEGSGPSVSATMKSTFGTTNPNAQPTQAGPFPGDPISFRATTNSPTAMGVDWTFGNPEAGASANAASSTTGVDLTHQYTALNTTAKVTASKIVTVAFSSDSSVNNSLSVNLKVPEPRIALKATGELITGSNFNVLLTDKFVDASDGSVESHYASWTIGGVTTKALPSAEMPVGTLLGPQTVEYSGFYGKYDGAFNLSAPFVTNIASRSYKVLPFFAKLKEATRSGSTVTYGATARFAADSLVLSASTWTYRWALTNANGTETASTTDSVPVGTNIPNFTFDKALLAAANGGKVTLTLTVAPGTVPLPAYEVFTVFADVVVPSPTIVATGCTNAGAPCSLLATATGGGSTAGWQLSWKVELNSTVVKTGTGNPLSFTPTSAGTYVATVTETVFDVSNSKNLPVAATLCGPPPNEAQMSISPSCSSQCPAGTAISFTASPFAGYQIQDCDQFNWNFGDGQTGTGRTTNHTYTSSGNKTVTLTVKNSANTTGTQFTTPVSIGGSTPPPDPGCAAPSQISFTADCATNCKAGTAIRFTGHRGLNGLLGCDSASWTFGDGATSLTKSPSKTYNNAGTYNVRITVTNSSGITANYNEDLVVGQGTNPNPTCSGSASEANVTLSFAGTSSGCQDSNGTRCNPGETVNFNAGFFNYSQQSCDQFLWNFGDGTTSTTKQSAHTYANNGAYTVTLKVSNSFNPTGVTVTDTVDVGPFVPAQPIPELSFSSFPGAGAKGNPVTFTVNSSHVATGWAWDFGDGVKDSTSQASVIGSSTSIQHTYTKTGTFSVSVKARNAADTSSAQPGQAVAIPGIVVTDVPEYKYLVPVVTHSPGQNNSTWRTDVQIYTPDSTVSPQTPLVMTADLRDIHRPLEVFNSTFYYEDFMHVFTTANDSGPVIITARTQFPPQIWSRTYNQTETGTFGQYIPAIRIDAAAGAGSAFGSGKYYLAGLRHDGRFRTNLGFLNPNAQTINATVKVYDDTQTQVGQFTLQLPPFQLDQFPITAAKAVPNLSPDRAFSLQVEVPQGQWLIGYASYIDNASGDPVYIQAVRESELNLTDYSTIVLPGVGHVGEWRSDVTIYNPDTQSVNVDLIYHDQTGAKVAEAKSVLIRPREFLSYTDFLKQGVLGNVPDSLGILRVNVSSPFPPSTYPLAFARTYNDKGTGKTFGQGINGFAAARANVKPGKPALIPGIRSNSKYYTNVGLTNVSNVPVNVTVKFLDPTSGAEQTLQTSTLQPNQSVVGRVTMPSQLQQGSLKIEVTGGNVWAFGSIVDLGTADPEYVAATPLQ